MHAAEQGLRGQRERWARRTRGCWEGFCEPHYLPELPSDWPPGWRCWAVAPPVPRTRSPFMGFRLLDLENQTVKWRTPTFGRSAVVTYAFATSPVTTPGARNCASMLPPAAAYEPSQDQQAPIPQRGRRRLPHVGEGCRDQLPRDQRYRLRRHPHRRPGTAPRPRLHQRRAEAGAAASRSRRRSSAARSSASTRSSRGRSASTDASASTTCATRSPTRSGMPSASITRAPPAS